ncbi:hypothetical protein EF914_29555 [Streptomyces sp. WAC05458]|uniref:hypothetical protein n=1 Tax=Streptomyces sp. WAC05458 TaxID=2487412 RepID=UPI000FC08491|nr:hypothetical protein [Streptomyces sp. WAC05458]RSS15381.1 hypothetical protein EF914_29555 [Streptomyces sp. WAC05458]
MIPHRATAAEPWPGWVTSRAAQGAYGEHLVRVCELIPALLYGQVMDRKDLAVAHEQGDRDQVLSAVGLQAMEYRDELLETAVVLDVLALCHPPGGYLPRPYIEEPSGPDKADELRTDASAVASDLASYDLRHGMSRTGDIPPALQDGCTESERDALRAYARREWRAREERHGRP